MLIIDTASVVSKLMYPFIGPNRYALAPLKLHHVNVMLMLCICILGLFCLL